MKTEEAVLLTKAEAMTLLNLRRSTFDSYRHAGWIPPPLQLGNLLRWEKEKLLTWVADGCPRGQS